MLKLKLYIILLTIIPCMGCAQKKETFPEKPNIIYIMTDDHATNAIGTYGSRLASLNPTPNLDKLASEGMVFENCFVSNSICTPSRATIITGQYSQTNGVLDFSNGIDGDRQYLPIEMKKRGYETAIIGKWHLHEEPSAFDFYSVLEGQGKYFNPSFREKNKGEWPKNVVQTTGHSTDVITNKAIEWLSNRKDSQKPFMLMYQMKAPHDWFEYAPRYEDYLADSKIPEPESLYHQPNWGSEGTRGKNDSLIDVIGSSVSNRHKFFNYVDKLKIDPNLSGDEATSASYQKYLKKYLRCVKGIDDNIGKFIQYLKDNNLYDNTIIIYSSDQGMMLGEHDMVDKRWMYEESMKMPFIIKYNKLIKAGSRNETIINNTDYAPTIIDLAGGHVPDYMQGKSIKPLLENEQPDNWRTASYYRYWLHLEHHDIPAHFGIRTKNYKLIFFYGRHWNLEKVGQRSRWWLPDDQSIKIGPTPPAWELYDLQNDPYEVINVYNNPEYKDLVISLKEEMKSQRELYHETDANYPHIQKIIDEYWEK
ncbi:sulfatase [Tamlana fucoidanivorans]|uniref:Sulfatase n=1 Tax=Allotamlana fucoidanivorans TaxID=2583814 RepID=A0A5C4SFC9_9FLAO|nr:sulfatase [Tamlana fucoidanivorans]TNJ42188.1 sulfatase [Tamlana fucoidanivorans]